MSSNAAKLIAIVAVILTLLLALVGYRVSRQYAQQAQPAVAPVATQPQLPKTLAVVALKPLAAYRAITKDDVALVELTVAPQDYYTSVDQVLGKQPIVDVDGGAPVTKRYFGEGNVLARAIPPGFQAVSVEISDVIAVGGFVRPGDMVDVLLYLRGTQDVDAAQARVLLKEVRVLAYEERLVDRPEGLTEEEQDKQGNSRNQQQRRSRTAVLAVPEAQTTRLMLGASQGELRLALYGQGVPGAESLPAPETTVAGGLPASPQAVAAIEADKVPDKALTIDQLARINPPPSRQAAQPLSVPIYRAAEVQTVSVKP